MIERAQDSFGRVALTAIVALQSGRAFGPEMARAGKGERVWFRLADTRLGLEAAPAGQKPGFSHFCVKVAGFNRAVAT